MALDAFHNLFVSFRDLNGVGQLEEWKYGGNLTYLGITLQYPGGIEIDNTDDIVVADSQAPAVDIYAMGTTVPEFQFSKVGRPGAVALNKREDHIYVVDGYDSKIREYTYPNGTLIDTVNTSGLIPIGIAASHPAPL